MGHRGSYRAEGLTDENWPGPECMDGCFPWMFWYAAVDPEEIKSEQHRRLLKMYAPQEDTNGNG